MGMKKKKLKIKLKIIEKVLYLKGNIKQRVYTLVGKTYGLKNSITIHGEKGTFLRIVCVYKLFRKENCSTSRSNRKIRRWAVCYKRYRSSIPDDMGLEVSRSKRSCRKRYTSNGHNWSSTDLTTACPFPILCVAKESWVWTRRVNTDPIIWFSIAVWKENWYKFIRCIARFTRWHCCRALCW